MTEIKQQLLDSITTAIILVDKTISITYMNSAAENLFACSAQQMQDRSVTHLFRDHNDLLITAQDASKKGQAYTKRQAELTLQSGKIIHSDYTVTPVFENEKKQLLIEFQSLDWLLKVNRDEALQTQYEVTRDLVSGLAHEIKNPLGGIRGAAQLLSKQLQSSDLNEYTDIIILETDRLRNLVDRMLLSNRALNCKPINIHEIIERVCTLLEVESQNQIIFTKDYDPSIPELFVDTEQIIQALLNIARNAWQAIASQKPHEGRITLKTRAIRNYTLDNAVHRLVCQISIIDNGPGIPIDLSDHIFYPMISGRAEGSGLGLSITQAIIASHKGKIEFTSEPGETQFILYLPFIDEAVEQ